MNNRLLTLLIFLMFASTVVGQGNTYFVKENGSDQANGTSWSDALTLQAALTKAKDYDEIRIAKGVYKPSVNPVVGAGDNDHRNQTFLITNKVKIYGGFRGDNENETLEARDLINNETVLSGDIGEEGDASDNAYHVVLILGKNTSDPKITPTLNGLTIMGGNSYGLDDQTVDQAVSINQLDVHISRGGGIHNRFANPIIKDVTVKDNAALTGGGIFNYYSDVELYCVTISGNKAQLGGGGIYNNNSFPTLTNVSIVNNESKGEFTGGGGMYNSSSSPILTNVTIAGNKAAYYGGGMFNLDSSPTLTNVTITGNKADIEGGGMINLDSSPTLTNVTIAGNKAEYSGGGMFNDPSSYPKIFNSIIWGNKAVSNGNNVYNMDSYPEFSHSLIEGSGGSGEGVWDRSFGTDGGNNINADPLFIEPIDAEYAPTSAGNYRLAAGSPAIDKGSASYLEGVNTDLDGNKRNSGTAPDMGAYEYQQITPADGKIIYVNANVPLGDNTGSSWSTALPTLGEALDYINEDPTGRNDYKIYVAGGTYYPTTKVKDDDNRTTTDRDKAFLLLSDVAIYGGYSGKDDNQRDIKQYKTILSGDVMQTPNDASDNAYHVVVMVGSDNRITPTLNGLTITGGNASDFTDININGQQIVRYSGGGIYNRLANPYIQDVTIIGNKAEIFGGGIYNEGSSPAITNVLITGNRSSAGGGMANMFSELILTNVTISGNYASGDNDNPGMGGGILNIRLGALIIRNSIIWGNIAKDNAAGNDIINLDDSDPQFYHSLVGGDGDWISDWGEDDGTNIIAGPETQLFVGYIDPTTLTLPTTDGDYHLAAGSPAIDAGSTYPGMVMTDLDGKQRDDKPDLGAYEYVQISTTPPPSPNPTYTINVPEVEGVTTTPGAGLHEVKPGNSFEISITPGDEYDESELLIYANDILLQPVATGSEPVSYTYRIESVETAVTFRIEGVQKNDEVTGIDSPGSIPNYRLYTQPGLLMIDALLPGHLTITAIDGRTITRQRITEGTTRVSLPAGVYVVRIGDEVWKVVVRSK